MVIDQGLVRRCKSIKHVDESLEGIYTFHMLSLMFKLFIVSKKHLLSYNLSYYRYNFDKLETVLAIDDSELSIGNELLSVQENKSFQNESLQDEPEEKDV